MVQMKERMGSPSPPPPPPPPLNREIYKSSYRSTGIRLFTGKFQVTTLLSWSSLLPHVRARHEVKVYYNKHSQDLSHDLVGYLGTLLPFLHLNQLTLMKSS